MIISRFSLAQIVALSTWLIGTQLWAAERKEWVRLTNCQYITHDENDGDSFRVRCEAKEFALRLYFVDAPETNLRYPERTREQSEYFGVTLDETMKGGRTARDLVRETLREPFTVWTRWAIAAGRSATPRYYALLMVGANRLDELLVRKGLAQPKGVRPNLPTGEKATAHLQKLYALEADAKKQRVGLWTNSTEKKAATIRP
jgi:endonuclease YncB( thermonuclease family)